MDKETEFIHESIHAEYRQALMEAQWALSRANAQLKLRDRVIAAQAKQIEELTKPAEDGPEAPAAS